MTPMSISILAGMLIVSVAPDSRTRHAAECRAFAGRAFLAGVVLEDSTLAPALGVYVILDGPGPDTTSSGPHSFTVSPRLSRGVSTDSTGRFCFPNGGFRARRRPFVTGPDIMELAVDLKESDSSLVIRYDSWGLSLEEQEMRARQFASLLEARARWAAARPLGYSFEISLTCFCFAPPPAKVYVKDGALDPSRSTVVPGLPGSIDALFRLLETELEDRERGVDTVSYDSRYGFPAFFRSDTRGNWTDGHREWRVASFQVHDP
jgi:uncharacterized protein DUF6174